MTPIKHITTLAVLTAMIMAAAIVLPACEPDDDPDDCDTCIQVYKPNIYLYPEQETTISVKLDFPKEGRVVTSIPEYGQGWKLKVSPDGTINDSLAYLFYESSQPDVWQTEEGWIIPAAELRDFFTTQMQQYGFRGREITDFNTFWIPLLSRFSYVAIYPQDAARIDRVIRLQIDPAPAHVLRLFFLVEGLEERPAGSLMDPPPCPVFDRSGYHAAEWGVVIAR